MSHDKKTVIAPPAPGIYPGVDAATYHAWDAASNSRLNRLLKSPAHLRAYIDAEEQKETPARKLGRAIHCAVLEPDHFGTRYVVAEQCAAVTDKGKRCVNTGLHIDDQKGWVCGVHAKGRDDHKLPTAGEPLSSDDRDVCIGIQNSIKAHPYIRPLLRTAGACELSIVWVCPFTGVICKARLDWHTSIAGGAIVDLKSAIDGGILDFEKVIWNWGYFRQASFYRGGAEVAGLPARRFNIVAAEKDPPYAVAGYRVSDSATSYVAAEHEHSQIRALLELYRLCFQNDQFPGFSEEIREIGLPDWAWPKIDHQTAEVRKQLDTLRGGATNEEAA